MQISNLPLTLKFFIKTLKLKSYYLYIMCQKMTGKKYSNLTEVAQKYPDSFGKPSKFFFSNYLKPVNIQWIRTGSQSY